MRSERERHDAPSRARSRGRCFPAEMSKTVKSCRVSMFVPISGWMDWMCIAWHHICQLSFCFLPFASLVVSPRRSVTVSSATPPPAKTQHKVKKLRYGDGIVRSEDPATICSTQAAVKVPPVPTNLIPPPGTHDQREMMSGNQIAAACDVVVTQKDSHDLVPTVHQGRMRRRDITRVRTMPHAFLGLHD